MTLPKPNRYTRIFALVQQHFTPDYIDLVDESGNHQVPAGSESHFKLTLVSTVFKNLSRLERHRCVTDLLMPERKMGLHALSLALYSPDEWAKQPQPHTTPPCQHQPKSTPL